MSKTKIVISYKLKKGVNEEEFLDSAKRLNDEYMSKQKGYISWQQLREKDIWVDSLTFESLEDAKAIENNRDPNPLAEKFYSYIKLMSCKTNYYSIERDYK